MQFSTFISGRFPGLNDYSDAERTHYQKGGKMKKEWTDKAAESFKNMPPIDEPIFVQFLFVEKNYMRDPDNFVAFARKCILDGMQKAGKLPNDNMKWVTGWEDAWEVDKDNPGVKVTISW